MTKAFFPVAIAALAACIAGCAADPKQIAPIPPLPTAFAGLECEQLTVMAAQNDQSLESASSKQKTTRTQDTVGVILLGAPLGSMSGGDVAHEVAVYKGRQIAIAQRVAELNCGATIN